MKIKLTRPFARNSAVAEYDVMQVKKALNRLGYYRPRDGKFGITDIPDADMFAALKTFQAASGLAASGTLKPGDDTVDALNAAIAKTPEGYYIWRTAEDSHVRPAHEVLNRKLRKWSDSPNPGDDFGCRCWVEPVSKEDAKAIYDDAIKRVYPESFLIPLLPIKRLYTAWKIWNEIKEIKRIEWTLGNHKSETKWANQLKNRDWTPEEITETIKFGKKYSAPNKINPNNGATRYEYGDRFVVRDNKTKDILQVSGKQNFKPNVE